MLAIQNGNQEKCDANSELDSVVDAILYEEVLQDVAVQGFFDVNIDLVDFPPKMIK